MLAASSYQIWMNAPRPGPNVTVSDCYPEQFMTSFEASRSGTTMPAFKELLCPNYYTTAYSDGKYVACCPKDFMLDESELIISDRYAFGKKCYSAIQSVTVTIYGVGDLPPTTTTWTAPNPLAQAYAHPIDGYHSGEAISNGIKATTARTTNAAMTSKSSAPAQGIPTPTGANGEVDFSNTGVTAESKGPAAGMIVGIVLGAVFLALFVAVSIIFYCRLQRRQKKTDDEIARIAHGGLPPHMLAKTTTYDTLSSQGSSSYGEKSPAYPGTAYANSTYPSTAGIPQTGMYPPPTGVWPPTTGTGGFPVAGARTDKELPDEPAGLRPNLKLVAINVEMAGSEVAVEMPLAEHTRDPSELAGSMRHISLDGLGIVVGGNLSSVEEERYSRVHLGNMSPGTMRSIESNASRG